MDMISEKSEIYKYYLLAIVWFSIAPWSLVNAKSGNGEEPEFVGPVPDSILGFSLCSWLRPVPGLFVFFNDHFP